ncbi:hypothetical protein J4441_00870 [Candidatus Micrarchaeota archaeon]|nr:hypothetical protein [Candidatus Micrarchaeota archaeon]
MEEDRFDLRLECLMKVINEDWNELETEEVGGALVIRLKKNVKFWSAKF